MAYYADELVPEFFVKITLGWFSERNSSDFTVSAIIGKNSLISAGSSHNARLAFKRT